MGKSPNHGGKRPGAGRPEGSKQPQTIEKEAARSALRQLVLERLQPLVDAQVAAAMGIKYLVLRDKRTGKFTKLTKEAAEKLFDSDDTDGVDRLEVWEQPPSVPAFTDLMNRAIDKPIEQQEHSGSVAISVSWQGDKK